MMDTKEEIRKILWEVDWKHISDAAIERIMQICERDGVEARSSDLLARAPRDMEANEPERQRGSDVGPRRNPSCFAPYFEDEWTDHCAEAVERLAQRQFSYA